MGLPQCLIDKESTCNAGDAGDLGLISGLGGSLGVGHGNSLQYSCLENSMDREAWQAIIQRVHKELDTAEVTEYAHTQKTDN